MRNIPVHCEESTSNDWRLNSIRGIPVVRGIVTVQSLFLCLFCKPESNRKNNLRVCLQTEKPRIFVCEAGAKKSQHFGILSFEKF
jgi:hypothetical protein